MAAVRPTVFGMDKTGAPPKAESITRGNIARLRTRLDAETNRYERIWLEILLTEHLALIAPD